VLKFEPFLLEEETLLGSCGTGRGFVCATDLRLLSVQRTWIGRRIRDLSYGEVSSVAVVDRLAWRFALLALPLVAAGLALPAYAPRLLSYLDPSRPLRFTSFAEQSLSLLAYALIAAGLLSLALVFLRRRTFVELDGPHTLRGWRARAGWRFAMPTASDARVFAGLVRKQIAGQSGASGRKVLRSDAY
jgi:hypothetical protein